MLRTSFSTDQPYGYSAEVLYARGFSLDIQQPSHAVSKRKIDLAQMDGRVDILFWNDRRGHAKSRCGHGTWMASTSPRDCDLDDAHQIASKGLEH